MRDFSASYTIKVRWKGRCWAHLGIWIMRLGAKIGGFGFDELELLKEDSA